MTAYLKRVSLTGVDNETNIDGLSVVGNRYPFVEWAMLYVPHNEGAPRNPTKAWRDNFINSWPAGWMATHLCGDQAFEQLIAGTLPDDISLVNRIQLNINARKVTFKDDVVVDVYRRALLLGPDVILQHSAVTDTAIKTFLAGLSMGERERVHILLDESKGRGVLPETWKIPSEFEGLYCGFAGGINPENVASVLEQTQVLGINYWIDMESGIRNDNKFSLDKAHSVLETASTFI